VGKFPSFKNPRMHHHVQKTHHWTLTGARSIHSTSSHPNYLRYILLLSSHLRLGLRSACFILISYLAYSSTVKMEATWSPKRRLTFDGLHSVISQKTELFITTAVPQILHVYSVTVYLTTLLIATIIIASNDKIMNCKGCGRKPRKTTKILSRDMWAR
jgi:hypothetical protein